MSEVIDREQLLAELMFLDEQGRLPPPPPPAQIDDYLTNKQAHAYAVRDIEASKEKCRDFYGFVQEAWHVLEPNTPFIGNWHIEAKCRCLQAISAGKFNHPPRLQINEPGGFAKSIITSVMWQAWEWGPLAKPWLRYFTTSYHESYAKRDARRTRDLIESEWYQLRWPVELTRTAEMSFANTAAGYREAVPFNRLTAGRGNRVIIDDPHSTEQAESEAERETALRIFRESVQDRLNDPKTDAIIVIMHRLNKLDLCGAIEDLKLPYMKLITPMEFVPERKCRIFLNGELFWEDPRKLPGELLFPERMGRSEVDQLKAAMGSVAWSAKCQQDPTPREGAMFKRAWFPPEAFIKEDRVPRGTIWVRHWDLAATKKGGDRTAGVKMGVTPDRRFVIANCYATQESGAEVRSLIKSYAKTDGYSTHISLPQDPGQAGKTQAEDYIKMLQGYVVKATPETGDKPTRAEPFAAQCEAGNVLIVEGTWNEPLIDELCEFPNGKFKDRVDACSGAFSYLTTQELSTYTLDNIG